MGEPQRKSRKPTIQEKYFERNVFLLYPFLQLQHAYNYHQLCYDSPVCKQSSPHCAENVCRLRLLISGQCWDCILENVIQLNTSQLY